MRILSLTFGEHVKGKNRIYGYAENPVVAICLTDEWLNTNWTSPVNITYATQIINNFLCQGSQVRYGDWLKTN